MPPATMRDFRASLERGTFPRAILLYGDEEFLKDEQLRALIARATDPGTREFNLDVRRAPDLDAGALNLLFEALPVLADRRVVVLRDATGLRKDARAALDRWLSRPPPDTLLVLVAAAGETIDADLVERTTAVECRPLGDAQLPRWVARQASTLGVSIDAEATRLLIASTGGDLALLAGELAKLRDFTSGAPIDEAAVAAVVGVRHGETLVDLLDRVATRDASGAAALVPVVLAQPTVTGVKVTMALTTQMLAIGWALAVQERGVGASRLPGELFALLKQVRPMTFRPWAEAVRAWVGALPLWDRAAVERALRQLLTADASLKETRVSSDEQVLTSLVLAMCASAAPRAAA
jgi:DNA polymerase-3 subunit delta